MGIKGYNHPGKKKVVVAVNPDGSVERVFDYIKPALKAHFFRGGMKTQTDESRYVL